MPLRRPGIPLLVLAVVLASCTSPATRVVGGGEQTSVRVNARPATFVTITGIVRAPAGILSNNGGSLISDKGSELIGQTRMYRSLQLDQPVLAGATVFAADAAGRPLPGIPSVLTDAEGRFKLTAVAGLAFAIVARARTADGRAVELRTLTRAVDGEADVDAITTLVTLSILDGRPGFLGDFDAVVFAAAVRRTAESIGALPDLADLEAMRARMRELTSRVKELEAAIETVRAQAAVTPPPSTSGGAAFSSGSTTSPGATPVPGATPAPGGTPAANGEATPQPTGAPAAEATPTVDPQTGGTPVPQTPVPGTPVPGTPTPGPTPTSAGTPTPDPGLLGIVTTLSDTAMGFADGALAQARFSGPGGAAQGPDGTLYVADGYNHRIRAIAPNGTVTTLAGATAADYVNGTGGAARFKLPMGIAYGPDGALYVADQDAHSIRRVTTAGVVTTLAGNGTLGSANGTGAAARFSGPYHLTFGSDGALYVADRGNHMIRRVTLAGVVTTIAGSGTYGSTDANGTAASFANPSGIAADPSGTLFVADSTIPRIRVIAPSGAVTTLAGATGTGTADGPVATATFSDPRDLVRAADGTLYIADMGSHRIRRIKLDGLVDTLAGSLPGAVDATGAAARFNSPRGLLLDALGRLVVCDTGSGTLRRIE